MLAQRSQHFDRYLGGVVARHPLIYEHATERARSVVRLPFAAGTDVKSRPGELDGDAEQREDPNCARREVRRLFS